jgi:hypothetical protein
LAGLARSAQREYHPTRVLKISEQNAALFKASTQPINTPRISKPKS